MKAVAARRARTSHVHGECYVGTAQGSIRGSGILRHWIRRRHPPSRRAAAVEAHGRSSHITTSWSCCCSHRRVLRSTAANKGGAVERGQGGRAAKGALQIGVRHKVAALDVHDGAASARAEARREAGDEGWRRGVVVGEAGGARREGHAAITRRDDRDVHGGGERGARTADRGRRDVVGRSVVGAAAATKPEAAAECAGGGKVGAVESVGEGGILHEVAKVRIDAGDLRCIAQIVYGDPATRVA